MTSTDALETRAKAAYERGRVRAAAQEVLLFVPFVLIADLKCKHFSIGCLLSVVLIATLVVLRWRGGVLGRAAMLGALVALPSLLMPACLHACVDCNPAVLHSACAVLCPGLGLFAGGFLGAWSAKQGTDRNRALLGGGLVIALAGALGCGVLGLTAIGGMWLATTVATLGAVGLARSA
jgi:hypothetical protein